MKRFIPLAVAAAGFTLMSAAPASAAVSNVYAAAATFAPPGAVIHVGDSVQLMNEDVLTHTLTSTEYAGGAPLFDTGFVAGGGHSALATGVETLAPGSHPFRCILHPWMVGAIVVTQ